MQLIQTTEPFKSINKSEAKLDILSTAREVLGIPTRRLGPGANAFWVPLRFDLSLDQLPTLLAKCGPPKQALILPGEVSDLKAALVSL